MVPAINPGNLLVDLNQFIATHRVVQIDRHWVEAGMNSFWAHNLTVADGPGDLPDDLTASRSARAPASNWQKDRGTDTKIDYRETLSAADFHCFAALRDLRKQIAIADGLPNYAVFTNEQLAAMVRRGVASVDAIAEIDRVGAAKAGKYGARFIAALAEARARAPAPVVGSALVSTPNGIAKPQP
jgi:superfamily II DNA helicase RecQ